MSVWIRAIVEIARADRPGVRRGECGSALVFSLLMIMILVLLGGSLLLIAATENRISENERLSAQALYAAETGVRVAKSWFDRPESAINVANPTPTIADRSLRLIDADGDPGTAAVAADGSAGSPYYKQGVDADADGADDLFGRPYRGSLADALLGTEAGPDLRIDEAASSAAATFLADLSAKLFGDYPGRSLAARITRVDLYAPPTVPQGGTWERFGMATVKVVARIYQTLTDGSQIAVAERMIKVVLNEIPYNPGGIGPLHSCDNLTWNGEFTVHWGTSTTVNTADLHNSHDKLPVSWPRVSTPAGAKLWGPDGADFLSYRTAIDGLRIEDPWLEVRFGGALVDAPNSDLQPWPFTWVPGTALDDGDIPYHPGPPGPHPPPIQPSWDGTHSNCFQNDPGVGCPELPYSLWKPLATAGGSNAHYYTWAGGSTFKENGLGAAQEFRTITDNRTGLFFFDTQDGLPPHDDDADGVPDNLTPEIKVSGGTWGVRGIVYLNSIEFATTGIGGRAVTFNAPGEPYRDADLDGRWDSGEEWVNLAYPATLTGPFVADASNALQNDGTIGATAVRNNRGPSVSGQAVVWGILYTNGYYDATGNGTYYGTIISKLGVGELGPTAGTPDLYWDESLRNDWPPEGWGLPRVMVTRWETDM